MLVDFWAPWCGPCKVMEHTIEQLANEFANKIKIGKLNIDENPKISITYSINAIPTFMLFKNGIMINYIIGVQPKEILQEIIMQCI